MKKSNRSTKLLILILTAFLLAAVLPVSAFAAKKEKKIKTMKCYENGKLTNSVTYTYNKKGLLTKQKSTYLNSKGKKITSTEKSSWTMQSKNSLKPKKRVTKRSKQTEVATYKYKGKRLVSMVTKYTPDNLTDKTVYDQYGNEKTYTVYNSKNKVVEYTQNFKNTYKDGILIKSVCTASDGDTFITTYDSKGNPTSYTTIDQSGMVFDKVTYINTYSGKYLKKMVATSVDWNNDTTVETYYYTYTSKKYPV